MNPISVKIKNRHGRIKEFKIVLCPLAEIEHVESERQYAHVFHEPRNTICVTRAFFELPRMHQSGIFYHEVGHLVAGRGATEAEANQVALKEYGVKIRYVDGPWGEHLEAI